MYLSSLRLSGFRNYRELTLELPARGALFHGDNGAGKTNLLEAIHLLCVGRSQRGSSRAEMIAHDAAAACVEGRFAPHGEGGTGRCASFGFDRGGALSMSRDGRRVANPGEWFGHCAVISFGPADLALVSGVPAERRRYLDLLAGQANPAYLDHLVRYQRSLANRNRLLASGAADDVQFEAHEQSMARHGAVLQTQRAEIVLLCQEIFAETYAVVGRAREAATVHYRPSIDASEQPAAEREDVFYKALKNKRKRDLELGFSSVGPHRDDLLFLLDEWPARTYASQGQRRSLALAARLCAARCLERLRAEPLLFLVDDAFSELDDGRVAAVYPLIRERGQVLMATPTPRVPFEADVPRFLIREGCAQPQ